MVNITARGYTGRGTAVSLGFFDGLHLGHIEVIKETLLHKELNSVVFTFGNKTLLPKFSTRENIISYDLRMELLEKIGIDYVFVADFASIRDYSAEEFVDKILVEKLKAKFVTCGYDFHFAKGGTADAETLKSICADRGIEVKIIPAVKIGDRIVSSGFIRELIRSGDVATANKFLGYELTYVLEVKHGNAIGRTLGFPTINQFIPKGNVIPKFGVYKSWTQIKGFNYPSVTNIGTKPTIPEKEKREPNMETHIIGYHGDLYGLKARVVLRSFLREERKFDTLEDLKAQLELDKTATLKL